ncbi:MAG: hypothetical protein WCQ16_11445 [Verrucomicrobiae bacterium]
MKNILLWIAVLPVAFIVSSAVPLGLAYLGGLIRRSAGESAGNFVEWIIFVIRGVLFVTVGSLLAPSSRVIVAVVLAIVQTLACVSPVGKASCRLATILGAIAALIYFIVT